MKKWSKEYWNKTWSRPYGRYVRHHQAIWESVSPYVVGHVLDIGCGTCLMYKNKTVSLVGVDTSSQALIEAHKNYPSGVYLQADARNIPLPDKQFDTVLMLGLLDYFDDWTSIVLGAKRLVKNDGRIFLTLLDGFYGRNWTEDEVTKQFGFKPKSYTPQANNWYLIEL